jgi:hypothetical protein
MEYAAKQGYHSIIIKAVPGDYLLIDSKQTLSNYGKTAYSTAHLKNPEVSPTKIGQSFRKRTLSFYSLS